MHLDRSTLTLSVGGAVAAATLIAASYALPVEAATTDRPRCQESADICLR